MKGEKRGEKKKLFAFFLIVVSSCPFVKLNKFDFFISPIGEFFCQLVLVDDFMVRYVQLLP